MNIRIRLTLATAAMAALLAVAPGALAQDESDDSHDDGNVFTLLTFKTKFSDIDPYLEVYEREWMPLVRDNKYVLSHRIFQHAWGPDWTILIIQEFESLSMVDEAYKKFDELLQERYPDEAERAAVDKAFSDLLLGHSDAIVIEEPKFAK